MIDKIITLFLEILNLMVHSYWGGLIFLLFGVWRIRVQLQPLDKKKYNSVDRIIIKMRGWTTAIGFSVLGVLIFYFKITREL